MRKFLCYDTEQAARGEINVDSRGMLTPLLFEQSDLMEADETELSFVKGQVFGLKRVKLNMHHCEYREGSQSDPREYISIGMYVDSNFTDFSKICIKINDKKFDNMISSHDVSSDLTYYGDGSDYRTMWESANGYGFRLEQVRYNALDYYLYVDESRFGPIKDVNVAVYKYEIATLPSEYLPNPIPYDHLPLATSTTPGVVIVPTRDNLDGYISCVIDANGAVYSKVFTPATVFSELSKTNLNTLLYVGEHGLFTDSINEEISSVVELVLPVHAWLIKVARTKDYVLESADGTRVLLQLGNGFNYTNATILHQPSSEGGMVYVDIIRNDDGSFSANKTHAEILEYLNNGANVAVHVPNTPFVAYYAGSVNHNLVFSQTSSQGGLMFSVAITSDNSVLVQDIRLMDYMLPKVTTSDNGKFLQVVDGEWTVLSDVVVPSSTSGSTKKFKITVDDTGTISATEVTT